MSASNSSSDTPRSATGDNESVHLPHASQTAVDAHNYKFLQTDTPRIDPTDARYPFQPFGQKDIHKPYVGDTPRMSVKPYHLHNCHSRQAWHRNQTEPYPCDCGLKAALETLLNEREVADLEELADKSVTVKFVDYARSGVAVPTTLINKRISELSKRLKEEEA